MTHLVALLLIVGSAADSFTTYRALSGSNDREANPIMRWVLERIGLVPMVLTRFAIGCGLAAWVYVDSRLTIPGAVFGMLYCIVAFRNWAKAR